MAECFMVWTSGEVWEWDRYYSPRRIAALIRLHLREGYTPALPSGVYFI